MKRHVFMISDGTGITAESLGNSLITQFENIQFEKLTIPYIDSEEKANAAVTCINNCYLESRVKPLVFMTLINTKIANIIKESQACVFDLFNTFLGPLEQELNSKSSYTVGRAHGVANSRSYRQRIEAVEYALSHDDGLQSKDYNKADIILIGVSRCGKTPSCIYMALHFGILAANYPFTDKDLFAFNLPEILQSHKAKLLGLTIDPERLHHIRTERRPHSVYASLEQCYSEVKAIEIMYQREKIPYLNSTRNSIEEIATKILASAKIKRKF